MSLFQNLAFTHAAHYLRELPAPGAPEIAFAGRSNSGKSSAINTLARRTRLAFVSKTPGRTQQINFFQLRGGGFLVDLPGYGYAKVPGATRDHWQETLPAYLQRRKSLCGLVLIMDARRTLTELDRKMLEWFSPTGRPVHVLVTKVDKVSKSDAAAALRAVRKHLAELSPLHTAQQFSSLAKTGMEEAEGIIGKWLEAAGQANWVPGATSSAVGAKTDGDPEKEKSPG